MDFSDSISCEGTNTVSVGKPLGSDRRPAMNAQKFNRSRSLIYFRKLSIVVFTTLVIALSVLYLSFEMKKNDNNELHVQFVGYADKIAENFNNRIHDNLLALDSFSISATSYALDTKNTWPMVTLPDFAIRSWTTRQEMRAETLGLLPIITSDKRQEWESYVMENHDWIEEAREWEDKKEKSITPSSRSLLGEMSTNKPPQIWNRNLAQQANFSNGISSSIYAVNMEGAAVVDEGMGPFSPIWMTSPAPKKESKTINFNLLSHHLFWQGIEDCMYSRLSVLSRVLNFESTGKHENSAGSPAQIIEEPISSILYPVFDNFTENNNLVAVLAAEIYWSSLLENALPDGAKEVVCVVETSCDQIFSFRIDGHKTFFLGPGDFHDPKLSNMVQTRGAAALVEKVEGFMGTPLDLGHCPFLLHVYPTSTMKEDHISFGTILLISSLLALYIFVVLLFSFHYDFSTRNGETDIGNTTNAGSETGQTFRSGIVSGLPKLWKNGKSKSRAVPQHLKNVIRTMPEGRTLLKSAEKIILTNATVMVAGICSLDTWGENREPEETTNLLETVHRSLTVISKRHDISPVEMIDGNFLAIVGSDDSDVDHAVILVYFACECRKRISELFKSMSAKELSIQFGVHSGNIQPNKTSNGEGSNRFQLFGDAVDTAYQMLENGKANRIHVSVDTAELLNLAGKSHWISPRSDSVAIKGRENMSSFWVKPKACLSTVSKKKMSCGEYNAENPATRNSTFDETNRDESSDLSDSPDNKFQRLVDQNTAILLQYLRAIYAKRLASKQTRSQNIVSSWDDDIEIGGSIIEEARETIQVPSFNLRVAMNPVDLSLIELSKEVHAQLRVYVASIGSTYQRKNAFHNFEHASHTVLAMDQMIKKVTSSSDILHTGFDGTPRSTGEIAQELDTRTFSINSDPLVQFAMIFSALVHDVDHMGVSNKQLIRDGSPLASLYNKRCISEQNSVDISWWLLMKADFDDLRSAIYSDTSAMRRFRQVLVNSVIATDILDCNMKQHRDNNWNKVFVKQFKSKRRNNMDANEKRNLQATSAIECIMQAADYSHGIESFRTYMKWNERLFEEMYQAYHTGRSEANPALQWYKSELAYFDKFLIPLLSRLTNTGVFGGSGEVYLRQASDNRNAWKTEGEVMVQDMVDRFSRRIVAAQEDTICFS